MVNLILFITIKNLKSGLKIWTDTQKKIHRWQRGLWKDAQLGNCKIKQWDNTMYFLECLKCQALTILNASEDGEPQTL